MNEAQVSKVTKHALVQDQIGRWSNTFYDASVTVRVAKALDDTQMQEQAEGRMQKALKALDVLKAILEEVKDVGEGDE